MRPGEHSKHTRRDVLAEENRLVAGRQKELRDGFYLREINRASPVSDRFAEIDAERGEDRE
jgi:hypothetical protein